MISAHQFMELAGSMAETSGKLDLGLDAVKVASLAEHGNMSRLYDKTFLIERLYEFCAAAVLEYSQAVFRIQSSPGGLFFVRSEIFGDESQIKQLELYVFKLMVDTIRIDLGDDWFPARIEMQSECGDEIEPEFGQVGTKAQFGRPETRIFISLKDLRRGGGILSQKPSNQTGVTHWDNYGEFTETLISNYVGDPRLTLPFISKISGIHERQLQRHLDKEGTSFSRLLKQCQTTWATDALANSQISISEISRSLGYSNQAHFSRAFTNMIGMSPLKYRKSIHSN